MYDNLGKLAAWIALFAALELCAFLLGAVPHEFMRDAGQFTASLAAALFVVRYVARRQGWM